MAASAGVGVWYILKKHWVANNLLGLAFAVNGVELLHLSNVVTGCILLGGLFFYDIFWVFGTDVMVTVAKSFEAPIKLVFPQVKLYKRNVSAQILTGLRHGHMVLYPTRRPTPSSANILENPALQFVHLIIIC